MPALQEKEMQNTRQIRYVSYYEWALKITKINKEILLSITIIWKNC